MRKIIAIGMLGTALLVSACNTVSGIGRDVQAAGRVVTNSSESARR